MKKQLGLAALVAAVALGWAGSAGAADMPVKAAPLPPPVPTWTGTYIGINGGWGWGTTRHTDSVTHATTGDFDQDGGLAGVTWGGNWQMGRWVLGFEGDIDWANIKGNFNSAALCSVNGGTTCYTNVKSLSTERFRLGYDVDGWLLYATGGAAFGRVDAGQTPCGLVPGAFGNSCGERWRTGWAAGAGIEKMIFPKWSAKIEYMHYDFGDRSFNYNPGVPVIVKEEVDTVRVGLNYFFDFTRLLP